ncbi:hypothetical protein D3C84_1286050 [compost metagenome]
MFWADDTVIGKQARPLKDITQLSDIAGETVQAELLHHFAVDLRRGLAGHALQQAFDQQWQVVHPLP